MRWIEPGRARAFSCSARNEKGKSPKPGARVFLLSLFILSFLTSGVRSAEDKLLTIYSPGKVSAVPVTDRGRTEYVDLIAVLDPLGKLDVRQDGPKWKLRLDGNECQFQEGKSKGKVRGHDFVVPQPLYSEQGRLLFPLPSLPSFLQSLLRQPLRFHAAARRLFVGSALNPFGAEFINSTPPKLIFNFTGAVSPAIANEPGKMEIVFSRDPVVSTGPDVLAFKDNTITSAAYEEKNGGARITIHATAPLLATFSNGGKTLTVTPAPSAVATNAAAKPSVAAATGNAPPPPPPPATSGITPPARVPAHRFLVAIDPSHGGDERGAALSDALAEKDLTLSLARTLRQELQARGVDVLMLRDADTTLTTDQRAIVANTNRAALYLCLHAGSLGKGVRLYTSLVPAEAGSSRGDFIPWDLAQSGFLNSSRQVASTLAGELQARQVEVRVLSASLPPLNHVAAPAIAVEVAPRGPNDVSDLTSLLYQKSIASALAAGVVSARNRMEPAQ